MKFSAETKAKIIERDAARARLAELQVEQNELHAKADAAAAEIAEAKKRNLGRDYAEGKHVDVTKLAETQAQAQSRARVLTDAINYQRTLAADAAAAAARFASADAKAEHQAAMRNVVLGLVSALVSIAKARAIEHELGDLLSSSVLEPAGFMRLGALDDLNAAWADYFKGALRHGAVTPSDLRAAFGDLWPIARKSLQLDDTPLIKAGRAVAAAMGA